MRDPVREALADILSLLAEINIDPRLGINAGKREAAARAALAEPSAVDELVAALCAAIRIAEEARVSWDVAPEGMRAGKILIALTGNAKGYRADTDEIHRVIAKYAGAAP